MDDTVVVKADLLEREKINTMAEFSDPEDIYQGLIQRVKKYHPSGDISLIEKAFNIAREAHKNQFRKSGEPYIIHPCEVAKILAGLEVDTHTLIAAFLIDFVAPQIADTVALLSESCARALNLMLEKVQAGVFREGVFYFLLGWYLVNTEISQKQRRLIYILGGIGLLYTVLFSSAISIWKGYAINGFYAPYRVNTALYSVVLTWQFPPPRPCFFSPSTYISASLYPLSNVDLPTVSQNENVSPG